MSYLKCISIPIKVAVQFISTVQIHISLTTFSTVLQYEILSKCITTFFLIRDTTNE